MPTITKELKLALAKDITCAYVRNEASKPNAEEAAAMFKAMLGVLDEITPDTEGKHKVGLG